MFSNANVLFRTKFIDGVSTVTRYTQKQSGKAPLSEMNGDTRSAVTVKSKDSGAQSKRKKVAS